MKFHNAGKYNGDENSLPKRDHPENYVPFKEPEDMKKLAIVANALAIALIIILAIPFFLRGRQYIIGVSSIWMPIGCLLSIITFIPHEFIHALCFKEDVYMYENLKQGVMFVAGTEDMSKCRFILMSLMPNIIFGFLPFIIYFVFPHLVGLGAFGWLCTGMGAGDYMNVFNAICQVPRGAKIYMSGLHSYWYMP